MRKRLKKKHQPSADKELITLLTARLKEARNFIGGLTYTDRGGDLWHKLNSTIRTHNL